MSNATAPEVSAQLQSFLAFDFGTQRTGVAFGSRLLRQAQPLPTVSSLGDARWREIEALIQEWQQIGRAHV